MARQRAFDKEAALDSALRAFWRRGYEATSIAELTAAMGIRPPSLYGAFGDKRRLFEEAVRHYQETYGSFPMRALAEEPTARKAVERLLRELAVEYTNPDHPPGCLINSATVDVSPGLDPGSGSGSGEVMAYVRRFREEARAAIKSRLDHDVATGQLPLDTDAAGLATFFTSVVSGMSAQARDGASTADMLLVAELAMRAWPTT
jgi:AcrR family transcriptional regulator